MEIQEKLQAHVNNLFANTARTKASIDLKEELYANALDRYQDAVAKGVPEDMAFDEVTNSIGEIDELLEQIVFEEVSLWNKEEIIDNRKKRAVLNGLAAGLFILAGAVLLATVLGYLGSKGYIATLIIIIVPTVLLVFSQSMFPAAEIYRQPFVNSLQATDANRRQIKAVQSAMVSLLWLLATVVYFLVSFATYAWHITWIIFLIATCINIVLNLVFSLKK